MNSKKSIRESFRTSVFKRDCYACVKCGKKLNVVAHHITDRTEMPKGGYVKENGISLCTECHKKAEIYHKSNKKDFFIGYLPDDLYDLIRSSFNRAILASSNL